jgi:hypothetical protein
LTKKDVLVLVAGLNDITSDNCFRVLGQVMQFANQNNQTNIALLIPPLRNDQVSNVCTNDDVMKFNRKLWKYMKLNGHVTILESSQNRLFY